jgi:GNAT superfamily N-acetyltransferase
MNARISEIVSKGYRLSLMDGGAEAARARIYLIWNDLRPQAYALLEDVFVLPFHRGQGLGRQIVEQAILAARNLGCYKIVANSRHGRDEVHRLYKKLGFSDHGLEFRLDL